MTDEQDVFDPRPNGTIRMVVEGESLLLRRPRIGEFRERREALLGIAKSPEVVDAIAQAAAEQGVELPATLTEPEHDDDAPPDPDQADADAEQRLAGWWLDTFDKLESQNRVPCAGDPEALPTWLLGPDIIKDTLTTWLSVPRRPGGR